MIITHSSFLLGGARVTAGSATLNKIVVVQQ